MFVFLATEEAREVHNHMLTSSLVACEGAVMFRDGDRVRGTLTRMVVTE
jgi:hypothetical protein